MSNAPFIADASAPLPVAHSGGGDKKRGFCPLALRGLPPSWRREAFVPANPYFKLIFIFSVFLPKYVKRFPSLPGASRRFPVPGGEKAMLDLP